MILALFFVGARWADPDNADALESAAIRQAAERSDQPVASWRHALLAGVALTLVALPNYGRLQDGASDPLPTVNIQLPEVLGRWQAAPEPAQQWSPSFPKATVRLAQGYRSPAGDVTVHMAYYRGQRADVKLVSSVNGFVSSDQPWHILSQGAVSTTVDGRTIGWRRAVLTNSDAAIETSRQRLTVWRVYWLGGRLAHGDVEAKLIQAWQAVLGEPDDGAAIHLVSSVPNELAAEQQLAAFVNENFAMLERALAAAKTSR